MNVIALFAGSNSLTQLGLNNNPDVKPLVSSDGSIQTSQAQFDRKFQVAKNT